MAALDVPLRQEVDAGLDRASKLQPGHGWAELTAGVGRSWDGSAQAAFVRAEAGVELAPHLSAFGFGQADLLGAAAGIGARATW